MPVYCESLLTCEFSPFQLSLLKYVIVYKIYIQLIANEYSKGPLCFNIELCHKHIISLFVSFPSYSYAYMRSKMIITAQYVCIGSRAAEPQHHCRPAKSQVPQGGRSVSQTAWFSNSTFLLFFQHTCWRTLLEPFHLNAVILIWNQALTEWAL